MTALKDMTTKGLRQKEQEIKTKISEMSKALQQVNSGKAQEKEYSEAYTEHTRIKKELEKREAEERRERLNASKRPLPDTPETYLTHEHYFNKKKELEEREHEFVEAHEQAVAHLKEVSDKYDAAVLNGSDDEISALYDELQQAKKQKSVMQSKLKSLQDSTKQQTLEDTAMEVILSRVHVDDMVKDDRAALLNRYDEAKRLMEEVQRDIKQFNASYDSKMKNFQKIMFDLGDNSGLGLNLISKYRKHPGTIQHSQRIKLD